MHADAPTRQFMENPHDELSEQLVMLTVSELAYLAGTSPEMIEQLREWEIIVPIASEPEPLFPADTLPLVRKVLRIHAGLGIDFPAMPLMLDLLDRIASLEQHLSDLEEDASS